MADLFGEPISIYTRAQAIEDGELIDVTEWASAETGMMGGYRCPVAVTRSVWADLEYIPRNSGQDLRGRAHDLLWMSSLAYRGAVRRQPEGVTLTARFKVIMPVGRTRNKIYKLHAGPGDAGELVITIMQPDED